MNTSRALVATVLVIGLALFGAIALLAPAEVFSQSPAQAAFACAALAFGAATLPLFRAQAGSRASAGGWLRAAPFLPAFAWLIVAIALVGAAAFGAIGTKPVIAVNLLVGAIWAAVTFASEASASAAVAEEASGLAADAALQRLKAALRDIDAHLDASADRARVERVSRMLAFAPRSPFENRAAATEMVAAAEKLSVALAARNATAGDEALATIERSARQMGLR